MYFERPRKSLRQISKEKRKGEEVRKEEKEKKKKNL